MLLILFELIFLFFIRKECNLIAVFLISLANSSFFSFFLSFIPKKISKKISYIIVVLLLVIFITHTIYYAVFGDVLSISTALNNITAIAFYEVIIDKLIRHWYILVMYVTLSIIYILLIHRDVIYIKKNKFCYAAIILFIISGVIAFGIGETDKNVLLKNVKEYGLLTTIQIDLKNYFLSSDTKMVYNENNESYSTLDYNILNTKFIESDNEEINEISKYLRNSIPSNKNEYTGIFKGKNLIIILAESFSEVAIDKDLTPTLYKLYNEGIKFENYYSPTFRIGTADAEYMLDNSLLPVDINTALIESNDNYMIYNYANVFKENGYNIYSYHNYDYDYYERDKYFKNLDYNYLACGNGLEDIINCNARIPSDYEMMKETISDYIDDDNFMTYYVTMSGHFNYDSNHTIVKKNYDLVKELSYSEKVRYYMATQIELDRGVNALIDILKEKNKLEDTVIMIVGDHYPHGLTLEEFNEISTYERDKMFEKVKMPLIIYNSEVSDISTDKYFSMIDILPTILNLYGFSFDSRLLLGRDVFSDNLTPVIFYNRSFITEKGKYNSLTEKFSGDYDKKYISSIQNDMYNKFRISRLILENDYYKIFKTDN